MTVSHLSTVLKSALWNIVKLNILLVYCHAVKKYTLVWKYTVVCYLILPKYILNVLV